MPRNHSPNGASSRRKLVPYIGHFPFECSCALNFATHNISYSISCVRGSEVLKISLNIKPTAGTAGGTPLKPRHEWQARVSKDNVASAPGDAEGWYEYDSATGLLTVSHVAHAGIVIV